MLRRAAPYVLALVASSAIVSACTPVNSYMGFQAIEARPQDIKVGEDNMESVKSRLGSPSAISTFDPDVWFYVSQVTQTQSFYKPKLIRRDVVAVSFDKDTRAVTKVDTLTMKDGRVIAYNGRETPTRGRELTFLEQLIGSIGNGQLSPIQEQNPGTGPGH
jgi:outer membrane protein assembly factor BamE (lipoprotein component of BamABCDE complex)